MSKKPAIRRAFQSSDEKENTLQMPSLEGYADNTGRKGGTAAGLDVLIDKDVAYGARIVPRAVAAPSVFAPVLPTVPAEPLSMVAPAPQYSEATVLAFDAEGLGGESVDGINGRPGLGSTGGKKSQWIKHTLASGLVIEVEATRSNSPIQAVVNTPSSEPSQLESDDYYNYTHLEDWILDSRQGSNGFFEQYIEECRAQQELPFHQRTIWQGTFIPTLLKFLGTRSDPWDFSGDAFITILPAIWLTIYHEPSWPEDDDALVRSLVSDSIFAWLESFASNALAAIEKFLKGSMDDSPSFSRWSQICEGMMRDYRVCFDHTNSLDSSDLFNSMFVLAPLSGHLQAIRGGKQVEGLTCPSNEVEYPFGAIGLAVAAALRAMTLFHAQLVGYDEDGNILVETSTDDTVGSRIVTTAFNKDTAEGRTRQHSSFACKLPHYELDAILSRAHELVLYPNCDEINSNDEVLNYADE